ncbi:MAG: zinc ribbon domain-containing protein [Chloracidobacterium sp.]|nr:zinc ribbon domain-containing protein [Chloracidobacterium sp.]
MFCPQCGQEKISNETNYCSRCGFLLVAVNDLLQTGGINPLATSTNNSAIQSARKRGLKQGLFLFLLTFLVAPLMGMISLALNVEPIAVGVAVIICFIGGLLRMVYALMFESAEPSAPTLEEKIVAGTASLHSAKPNFLPPQNTVPDAQFFAPASGNWRDTNDLTPTSVTESTTKLLEKDEIPQ